MPRDFSGNVPQGDVDVRDGGGAHHTVPVPEVLPIHHLPEMLDARRILAANQLGQVVDRAHHGAGVPLQRSFTPAK